MRVDDWRPLFVFTTVLVMLSRQDTFSVAVGLVFGLGYFSP